MKKVNLLLIYLYLFFIEFCCFNCYYNNLHTGHKLVQIEDEQSLINENLTIEKYLNEFNGVIGRIINLKNKIETNITEINKLFEKVYNEITISFKQKHEKLDLEEINLKEKLENETTKIKEKLENYLSETNRLIRINEKINKGIKKNENEKEKNLIRDLTYISKINKTQKEMKKLLKEPMKNIKISFIEEKSEIQFDEYYFNEILAPEKIEFKDITPFSVKVQWEIDHLKIEDNEQYKYKVEIKKENSNDNYLKVYEGNNNNCLIENLIKNTNYEIRICSIYKDIISPWKIQKVTTSFVDSIILRKSKREKEFLKIILEWSGYKSMELIYRGTKDGTTAEIFHNKCDNQGPTICLYENEKGNIFGGYASISWTNSGYGKSAPESFIFTLTNIYNTEPTKFINKNKCNGVYHASNQGPVFGNNDIIPLDNFSSSNNTSLFPECYDDILGKGKSIFTGNPDNNNSKFAIKEIEVFKLHK